VLLVEDPIERIPIRSEQELRGILRGIDAAIEPEPDRT
jgi:hypothetical protein